MTRLLNYLFLLLIISGLSSCVTYNIPYSKVYLCESADPVYIYESNKKNANLLTIVEPGKAFILDQYKPNKPKYHAVYKSQSGYVKKITVYRMDEVSSIDAKCLTYADSIGYFVNCSPKKVETPITNGTSSSSSSYSGGTVHVKGYYRKDGTYVKSHTRSAPSRSSYKSSGRRR